MIQNSNDKMIKTASTKAEPRLEKYFFSGSTEHEPQSIEAQSYDEALKIWEKTKRKVDPNQTKK